MSAELNHYDLLEVSPKASQAVIASAYRALSQRYHPDKNGGDEAAGEMMAKINAAYTVLSDPQKRKIYDEELASLHRSDKRFSDDNGRASVPASKTRRAIIDPDFGHMPTKRPNNSWVGILLLVVLIVAMAISNLPRQENNLVEKGNGVQRASAQDESERDKESNWEMAEHLLIGDSYPQNYDNALAEYFSIAKKQLFNDGRAEQRIAEMYFFGLGLPVDYLKARIWYEKASKHIFVGPEPLFMLGVIYERGFPGTQADRSLAYHYFNEAQARPQTEIYPNTLIEGNKRPFLDTLIHHEQWDGTRPNFGEAARQRKLQLEKSMSLDDIKQAQNLE